MIAYHAELLNLLSGNLFQEPPHSISEAVDWDQVVKTAAIHAVLPLIYNGMKANSEIPEELLVNVRRRALSCVVNNERVMREQSRVLDALESAKIKCAVLKGASVAAHYPQSELRVLGDVDVLVYESDLEAAKDILLQNGYSFDHEHEFHACYMKNGVCIEVHKRVSSFPDTQAGRFARDYMDEALEHVKEVEMAGHRFKCLDMEHELISLLAHMERHMVSGGINIRQLCDWAVTINAYKDRINSDVLDVIQRCGLLQYAKAMTSVCVRYFGMPQQAWANDVDSEATSFIMNEMLLMESLSCANVNRRLEGAFYQRGKGVIQSYISSINEKAKNDFPALSRCVILRPIFWIFYPLRWLIRSACGTRQKVSFTQIAVEANARKEVYSKLAIYE